MKIFEVSKLKEGIKINIKVIPSSSKCEIAGVIDGALKVRLDAPPVEGKANERCILFFSKLLGLTKSSVEILSGERSKNKTLFIKGNPEELESKLKSAVPSQLKIF